MLSLLFLALKSLICKTQRAGLDRYERSLEFVARMRGVYDKSGKCRDLFRCSLKRHLTVSLGAMLTVAVVILAALIQLG